MAQHDYVIANGTGAAVRSDLNGSLAAIVSNNSGATEPTTMYAYQWWPDTTTGLLKIRNAANNAWVTVGTLASTNLGQLSLAGGTMTGVLAVTAGTAALPGIAVSGDLNTGIFSAGSDQLAISTGGTGRLAFSATAITSGLPIDVPLGAVGTPSLTFTGDLNTGVFSPGADTIALVTGGTNRVHVTSGGLVGIDTTAPQTLLQVGDSTTGNGVPKIRVHRGSGSDYFQIDCNGGGTTLDTVGGGPFQISIGGSSAVYVDPSRRLLVGTSTSNYSNTKTIELASSGTGVGQPVIGINSYPGTDDTSTGYLSFSRSASSTLGTNTLVGSGDRLGVIRWSGANGTGYDSAAEIYAEVDGTPGATSDMPGRLVFSTTANGASSPTEQMKIDSAGNLKFNSGYGSAAVAYGCRAWVNFDGTGTVAIRASGNVSSITDNGTGDYTVNFTTALADVNYSMNATCSATATSNKFIVCTAFTDGTTGATVAPTTTAARFCVGVYAVGLFDTVYLNVSIHR